MTSQSTTVADWLRASTLDRVDAEVLLCRVLNKPRSYLFSHSDDCLPSGSLQEVNELSERRANGEPLAYITGECEFWSMSFVVSGDVLIPRADTETLVEVGLALWKDLPDSGLVVDAGTGSGIVAVAFAKETGAVVTAIDGSKGALDVAQINASTLVPGQVACVQSDWLRCIDSHSVRLLLSNPPYIASGDEHLKARELTHEPQSALVAGVDGLADLKVLANEAARVLVPGGAVAFEHGYDQGEAVRHLLQTAGLEAIATVQDLNGQDRVSHARRAQ